MASFDFYTHNAAHNNSEEARVRESTRMACIAYGLRRLGHDVQIVSACKGFKESNRWRFFSDMWSDIANPNALTVRPAEELFKDVDSCDVAIKCSVRTDRDEVYVKKCKVLVAHEYAKSIASQSCLLPVPFLVHDRVIGDWCEDHAVTMRCYLDDEVEILRIGYAECLQEEWEPPSGDIAFAGQPHYGRDEILAKMEAAFPGQCDFVVNHTPQMGGQEYMQWLASHKYALVPHGDTPKTNRWSEAALLGLAIISPQQRTKVVPPQTSRNTIMPNDWDDTREIQFLSCKGITKSVVEQATADYLEGWSPTGQARQICKWLGIETTEENTCDG